MGVSPTAPADDPAGATEILRDAGTAITRNPLIVVPFVLVAALTLASQNLANLVRIPVEAVASSARTRPSTASRRRATPWRSGSRSRSSPG